MMTHIGAAFGHDCAEFLKQKAALHGLDIHVSTEPPLVIGPYTTEGMVCPHGVTYWWEPAGEWIAYCVANGIA